MMGIYKIENLINGKVYIGQSRDIKIRWRAHKDFAFKQYKNDGQRYYLHLYNAIRKYGLENFSFEVIEETSADKLNEREIYWIKYYNSYENGYNNTRGGDDGKFISQEEIDNICYLWRQGLSISEIVNKVSYQRTTVITYLNLYEPSYSAEKGYERGEEYRYKLLLENDSQKKVDSFDLYNNYLGSFYLIRHASEFYKIDDAAIRLCCNGDRYSVGNYRFSYHQEPLVFTKKRHSTTPLYKIDTLNDNKITYYTSISEAASKNNCCRETIIHRLKDGKKTITGLYWKYVAENYLPNIENYYFIDKKQKILQIN